MTPEPSLHPSNRTTVRAKAWPLQAVRAGARSGRGRLTGAGGAPRRAAHVPHPAPRSAGPAARRARRGAAVLGALRARQARRVALGQRPRGAARPRLERARQPARRAGGSAGEERLRGGDLRRARPRGLGGDAILADPLRGRDRRRGRRGPPAPPAHSRDRGPLHGWGRDHLRHEPLPPRAADAPGARAARGRAARAALRLRRAAGGHARLRARRERHPRRRRGDAEPRCAASSSRTPGITLDGAQRAPRPRAVCTRRSWYCTTRAIARCPWRAASSSPAPGRARGWRPRTGSGTTASSGIRPSCSGSWRSSAATEPRERARPRDAG